MNLFSLILPLHEPVLIFTFLIFIILVSPFFFRLLKMPDVAAFIITGIIVGPYGLNILARDSSIELLGSAGLLYIMFMAGLELDPEKIKNSKRSSIIFGISTFVFPFLLGYFVSKYALNLEFQAIMLVSIMFSTHTLVAYPVVRKLGINSEAAVLTAIGGTIITDTLVLLILSVITSTFPNSSFVYGILRLLLLFGFYVMFIFYSYPKIARWFFKYVKRDRPVHYLFLLFMVSLSAILAELIGAEAIIGAFVAGIALNRSIPKNSLLMQHIDLVGNILFIPVFLLGIGMLINTRILVSGTQLWIVSGILVAAAFFGKWIAAYISSLFIGFSKNQKNLLFGLTSSHAAATIAIILIGYEKQMISITIFNATILIILISSLAATLITHHFGKKIALTKDYSEDNKNNRGILVPIANPVMMANLVEIAHSFNANKSSQPVYVLSIINEEKDAGEKIRKIREILEKNVYEFNNLGESIKVITRIDLSVSGGILRTASEYMVSDIVFGWGEKTTTSQWIFGSIFDHLLTGRQTLYAVKMSGNTRDYRSVVSHIPLNLEHEATFPAIIQSIIKLPVHDECKFEFRAESSDCLDRIKSLLPRRNKHPISYGLNNQNTSSVLTGSLNILFILRKQSVSFNARHNSNVQKLFAENQENSSILVVPGYGE